MRLHARVALVASLLISKHVQAQVPPDSPVDEWVEDSAATGAFSETLAQSPASNGSGQASDDHKPEGNHHAIGPWAEDAAVAATASQPLEPLSAAELVSLGISVEDGALDTDLHLSGFMDVTYLQLLNPEEASLVTISDGTKGSFFVGHLNLYATKNLTRTFSMMVEIRFTYAPNGTSTPDLTPRVTKTEVVDYSGSALSFRWGGLVIERAYGEWSPLPQLRVRLGSFLTPYGIWNVDHGAPVFVTVKRPFAVGGNYFPERQTGVELFGRMAVGPELTAHYHLTLSNGLGPVSEYRDLDSNKAVGGRIAFEYLGAGGRFRAGASVFYGEETETLPQLGISADGSTLTVVADAAGQVEVLSLAADLQWQYRSLLIQVEWVGQRRDYAEEGRQVLPAAGVLGIPPYAVLPDSFVWGGYTLLGYRLPWWEAMPYGTLEYALTNNAGILTEITYGQLGINLRPEDAIVLKLQYQFALSGTPGTKVKGVAGQLAWAF